MVDLEKIFRIIEREDYSYYFRANDRDEGIPRIFIIGETHYKEDLLEIQEEIIQAVSPKVIYHEGALKKPQLDIDTAAYFVRIHSWPSKFAVPVKLFDYHNVAELEENVSEFLQKIGFGGSSFAGSDYKIQAKELHEKIVDAIREVGVSHLPLRLAEFPVVAVCGAAHIHPRSGVVQFLKYYHGGCLIINQSSLYDQELTREAQFYKKYP